MGNTVRHIKRGTTVAVLGAAFDASTAGLNDAEGWQQGQYESRVYEEGEFSLMLPNGYGSDAVAHRDRFAITAPGVTYDPGDEWVEVYDDGTLLYTGTILKADPYDRAKIGLQGYDGRWLLRKQREYYAGYWCHAPRDVWEHYTGAWVVHLAEDFDGSLPGTGRSYSHCALAPSGSACRIAPGANATVGRVRGTASFPIGQGCANPHDTWQVKATYTRNRFGAETGRTGGDNARVVVGLYDTGANAELLYLRLQEKYTYAVGPDPTPGSTGPAQVEAHLNTEPPGPHEIIVEGRDRWVYFFWNQGLVAVLPMPTGSYDVVPFVSVRTGDGTSFQYADVENLLCRRNRPYLMRDPGYKGDYRLPGAPAPGGLWGSYYNDVQLHNADAYGVQVFGPAATQSVLLKDRLDPIMDFPNPANPSETAGGVGTPPNWQPKGTSSGLWWSCRWQGSIKLDLAASDVSLRYTTDQEGARMWVGKTRCGEEYLDNWLHDLGGTNDSIGGAGGGSLRTHIGHEADGTYHDGWYPILIEYGQRGTPGASFRLEYNDGSGWAVPGPDMLSPVGLYNDQIRAESYWDALQSLQETFGYQSRTEPRALESGYFPGVLAPQVRVGKDTDLQISAEDVADYGAAIDATGNANTLLGDGAGIAEDDAAGQLTVEALDYAAAEGQFVQLAEYEQFGEIGYTPLLYQRLASLLLLRGSSWEEVSAKPPGFNELRDTWPLTGGLSMLRWQAGDAVRLNFPAVGVVDANPRQMLGVKRPFYLYALGPVEVSWRQRPKEVREVLRRYVQRLQRKQRNAQGQYVTTTGSTGTIDTTGVGMDQYSRVPLPANLDDVVGATVTVYEKPAVTLYVWVNDEPTAVPGIDEAGTYDIGPYVQHLYDSTVETELPIMRVDLRTTAT